MSGESKNLESQRRELNGVEYFDRGIIEGKEGRRYARFAIHTHFIEVGEDQAEQVLAMMRRAGLLSLGTARDSAGFARVVCGRKTESIHTS